MAQGLSVLQPWDLWDPQAAILSLRSEGAYHSKEATWSSDGIDMSRRRFECLRESARLIGEGLRQIRGGLQLVEEAANRVVAKFALVRVDGSHGQVSRSAGNRSVKIVLRQRPGPLSASRTDLPPGQVIYRNVNSPPQPRESGLIGGIEVSAPLQLYGFTRSILETERGFRCHGVGA